MCGIFGIFNIQEELKFNKELFKDSLLKLKHRGPNATGVEQFGNKIILGHVRLSIIDISENSNQPFILDDRYSIVFNGEIYNYIELRSELKQLGYSFKTNSDTEVLVRSYQHWGESCVNRFNGDWAFVIYDLFSNKLFCSRDRFGVKPLNYTIINGQFIFSSEIKSIINYFPKYKLPNYNAISNYIKYGIGAQHEDSWFDGIKRLMPGTNLIINNGKVTVNKYWDYPNKVLQNTNDDEVFKKYLTLFSDSVKLRMRSDVNIGVTLSSGLDSTSIVSLIRKGMEVKLKTFTAVFNNSSFSHNEFSAYKSSNINDESFIVKKIEKDLSIDAKYIDASNLNVIDELNTVLYYLESGHSSSAVLPLFRLMKVAKEDVSVMLEGQGADELLAGYVTNNFFLLIKHYLSKLKIKKVFQSIFIFSKDYSLSYSFMQFIRTRNIPIVDYLYFKITGKDKLLGKRLQNQSKLFDYPIKPVNKFDDFLNYELYKFHTGILVNLLHYGDAISMANSIESRLPFLDHRLVEYTFQLPYYYKTRNSIGKYLHRKSLFSIVPDFILNSNVKFGFTTPLSSHFEDRNSEIYTILLSDRCITRNLFNKEGLKKIIDKHVSKKENYSTLLYRILSTELWFRKFID